MTDDPRFTEEEYTNGQGAGSHGATGENNHNQRAPRGKIKPDLARLAGGITAAQLQKKEFDPLLFVVDDFIPEGVTLLVSRPKLGKSYIVCLLALAVAGHPNQKIFGKEVRTTGDVLYLALEDGPRRLQRRVSQLIPTFSVDWPDRLTFHTEWRMADQGGIADLEAWIKSTNKGARLIIIDTLAKFRKPPSGKASAYGEDYSGIGDLQTLASKYNVSIVIVHHDRKAQAEDAMDVVSGTRGLTGAADTILVMQKQNGRVTLTATGRDIEPSETALQWDKDVRRYSSLGDAQEVNRSTDRKRVLEVLKDGPVQRADLLDDAGLARDAGRMLLRRLVKEGLIARLERGRYALPEHAAAERAAAERAAAERAAAERAAAERKGRKGGKVIPLKPRSPRSFGRSPFEITGKFQLERRNARNEERARAPRGGPE